MKKIARDARSWDRPAAFWIARSNVTNAVKHFKFDHPSALLRIPDREMRHSETRRFTRDLTAARALVEFRSG